MGRKKAHVGYRVRKLWQDDTAALVLGSLVLLVAIGATRYYWITQSYYHAATNRTIASIITTKDMPYRSERSHAILAVTQSLLGLDTALNCEHSDPGNAEFCDALNRMHSSFAALSVAAADTDSKADEQDLRDIGVNAFPIGFVSDADQRNAAIDASVQILKRYLGARSQRQTEAHAEIVSCASRAIGWDDLAGGPIDDGKRSPHERAFGDAGCDPPVSAVVKDGYPVALESLGTTSPRATHLLVASRTLSESCTLNTGKGSDKAPERNLLHCYTERVKSANDFSLLLEPILQFYNSAWKDGPLDPFEPRLVQLYFVSPDSLLRYADLRKQEPADAFGAVRLWGSSPFVTLPLEHQDSLSQPLGHDGRSSSSALLSAREMCSEIPSTAYLDLGGYGFVRTRCSCASTAAGQLIGAFCTDYTIPLSTRDWSQDASSHGATHQPPVVELLEHPSYEALTKAIAPRLGQRAQPMAGELFSWSLVKIPRNATNPAHCSALVVPHPALSAEHAGSGDDDHALQMEVRGARFEEIRADICTRIGELGEQFFQNVQRFARVETPGEVFFVVPVARQGALPEPDYLCVLLSARAVEPPTESLVIMIAAWVLFATMLIMRADYERSNAARLREESILRNLQVGVADVSGSRHTVIEFGNDRAEEILKRNLPVLGSETDCAGPIDLKVSIRSATSSR